MTTATVHQVNVSGYFMRSWMSGATNAPKLGGSVTGTLPSIQCKSLMWWVEFESPGSSPGLGASKSAIGVPSARSAVGSCVRLHQSPLPVSKMHFLYWRRRIRCSEEPSCWVRVLGLFQRPLRLAETIQLVLQIGKMSVALTYGEFISCTWRFGPYIICRES